MKMPHTIKQVIICILLGQLATPLGAHHSTAMFDDKIERIMTGVVSKFDYINPHSWLYIDIKDEQGNVTTWGFELSASTRLRRTGVSPNFWKKGDLITVKINPIKDGRPVGNLRGAITADGAVYRDTEGLTAPTQS